MHSAEEKGVGKDFLPAKPIGCWLSAKDDLHVAFLSIIAMLDPTFFSLKREGTWNFHPLLDPETKIKFSRKVFSHLL